MKANQAFKNNDEAVSPVIGVILMVAITVVLAAVVFILVTRLASNQKDETPKLSFTTDSDETDGIGAVLTITSWSGPANAAWSSFDFLVNNAVGPATTAGCNGADSIPFATTLGAGGSVSVGDIIDCDGATTGDTLIITYKSTNTVALSYEF